MEYWTLTIRKPSAYTPCMHYLIYSSGEPYNVGIIIPILQMKD